MKTPALKSLLNKATCLSSFSYKTPPVAAFEFCNGEMLLLRNRLCNMFCHGFSVIVFSLKKFYDTFIIKKLFYNAV